MEFNPRRRVFLSRSMSLPIALVVCNYTKAHAQGGRDQESNSPDEYPTSDPSVDRREDLSGNIAADRALSLEYLDLLLKLSDWLIDKTRRSNRVRAARDLGRLGHKYGLPGLLAVARDESEPDSLRVECVIALSMIRDKRVPGYLIDEWLGHDRFYFNAFEGLVGLVGGYPPELHDPSYGFGVRFPPDDPQERKHYVDIWRQWWAKHRDERELSRGPVLLTF